MKWKRVIGAATLMLCLLIFIVGFAGLRSINREHETQENMPEMAESNMAADFQSAYRTLNQDFFGKNALLWFTEDVAEMTDRRSEHVKGEFVSVQSETTAALPELIYELEKMIYQSLDKSLHKYTWEENSQSVYFQVTDQMGAGASEMNLEEMKGLFPALENQEIEDILEAYQQVSGMEGCENMFHIQMTPEQDNYVMVENAGGSDGTRIVWLTRREDSEFVTISRFETPNAGYGRVIQWGEAFYYIYLEYNYNLKNYDGVCLYRLGEDAGEEKLLIKYLPYNYIWENVYSLSQFPELDSYLESIRDDITSDIYLERGKEQELQVFCGDEVKVGDFQVPDVHDHYFSSDYYKIDFTNTGIPIYMRKSNFIPSNYNTVWHCQCRFFLQNLENGVVTELEEMEIGRELPSKRSPVMVQMWFKEIEDKVYTFCLYHVSDYNYVLNVSLLEGGREERIRTDIILPQRHFVLRNCSKITCEDDAG